MNFSLREIHHILRSCYLWSLSFIVDIASILFFSYLLKSIRLTVAVTFYGNCSDFPIRKSPIAFHQKRSINFSDCCVAHRPAISFLLGLQSRPQATIRTDTPTASFQHRRCTIGPKSSVSTGIWTIFQVFKTTGCCFFSECWARSAISIRSFVLESFLFSAEYRPLVLPLLTSLSSGVSTE